MSQKVDPSPTRHADTPRSQKGLAPLTRDPWFTFFVWGTSCEHNFSWTFRLPRIKIVLIFRSQHPPYWWCLVCRTASRGASSLGCLRKSRWSKFLVEMWIFKIDLKFRFEFFCCGMQSCAHHFSHTRIVFSACFTSSEIYFVHFSVCFFLRSIFGLDFS